MDANICNDTCVVSYIMKGMWDLIGNHSGLHNMPLNVNTGCDWERCQGM